MNIVACLGLLIDIALIVVVVLVMSYLGVI